MKSETITQRDDLIIRRHTLEPGEALPWHTDLCHRFTVVVRGEAAYAVLDRLEAGGRRGEEGLLERGLEEEATVGLLVQLAEVEGGKGVEGPLFGGRGGGVNPDIADRSRRRIDDVLGGGTKTGNAADDLLNSVERMTRGR